MISVDWGDKNMDLGSRAFRDQSDGVGETNLQNPNQGGIKPGEARGEEAGGDGRAEEGPEGP